MSQGLTLVTTNTMKRPFASGGFADVWKARNDNGHIFAVKCLRIYEHLVGEQGDPLLADFGVFSIMKNMPSVNTSTPHSGGTIRWTAPELLGIFFDNHKKPIPTHWGQGGTYPGGTLGLH